MQNKCFHNKWASSLDTDCANTFHTKQEKKEHKPFLMKNILFMVPLAIKKL